MFHLLIISFFFFSIFFGVFFVFFVVFSAMLRDSFSSRKEHTQCEREKRLSFNSKTRSGNINHVIIAKKKKKNNNNKKIKKHKF